ncbi:unnamed protein product [Pleuronectes platessa]|uniref:Uncharacterized protein n=1 Tax=Pleuronectes platessa TaxID=8262 RepID=A0A9N7U7M1_PLEPL|nr:unnamed protein product [Pleuronectes platessa]
MSDGLSRNARTVPLALLLGYGRAQRLGAPSTDLIVEFTPRRPDTDRCTSVRAPRSSRTCTGVGGGEYRPGEKRTLGFDLTTNHSRWGLRGNNKSKSLDTCSEQPADLFVSPFTIAGMSPSLPRSPARSQPPYSRAETHGRCVTSRSPLGSRTEAGEKKENTTTLPPRADGCASCPMAAPRSPLP